ncbi:DUF7301 family protein [Xenorhabdus szentirmaii]
MAICEGWDPTANQLLRHDLLEANIRRKRYWKVSSLPRVEKYDNRPRERKSPRDRVLYRLLDLDMKAICSRMTERQMEAAWTK